ncbi:MAG: MerR family transcriptional regulator [Solirubrobacteraceae bacterium]
MRTVGQVAELTGVTVRTLHHYDEIGLLSPSERSEAGYRLYAYDDLARLQEILVWRALGFSLAEIQAILDDPGYDRIAALRKQRALIEQQAERLGALRAALDAALAAEANGTKMEVQAMFDGFDPSEYEQEVRERWGHTEAYRESTRRAAAYGETEWREIRAEAEEITREFGELKAAGEPADGQRARALAERHRRHIARWFYDCPPAMHRGLGQMYTDDERFARNYETVAPGLAAYLRDAFAANAEEQGAAASAP